MRFVVDKVAYGLFFPLGFFFACQQYSTKAQYLGFIYTEWCRRHLALVKQHDNRQFCETVCASVQGRLVQCVRAEDRHSEHLINKCNHCVSTVQLSSFL